MHVFLYVDVLKSNVKLFLQSLHQVFRVPTVFQLHLLQHELSIFEVALCPLFIMQELLAFQIKLDFKLSLLLLLKLNQKLLTIGKGFATEDLTDLFIGVVR